MKINVGCGKQTWADFYCIDAVKHLKALRDPDLLHIFQFDGEKLLNPIPLNDGIADELHNYHFIEHVYAWEAPAVIKEFHRLLKPNGKLVMELPNISLGAKNLINSESDQLCMWAFYGDPSWQDPYMCHRWGYNPKTIERLLGGNGFRYIRHMSPRTHGKRKNRDMRIEAIK